MENNTHLLATEQMTITGLGDNMIRTAEESGGKHKLELVLTAMANTARRTFREF
jgi:hypothetical protein